MRINKLTAKKLDLSEPLIPNNSEIKRVKQTKSFGIIVGNDLNWEQHLKVVKGKFRGGLSSLKN